MTWLYVLGAVAVSLLISIPVTAKVAVDRRKKYVEATFPEASTALYENVSISHSPFQVESNLCV